MIELKDIRVGNNEIILKDNLVKSSILPQNTKELGRDIKVQDNVILEGGVFGNRINIEGGNVRFRGAVYANTELHVENNIQGTVNFEKSVATPDTIAAFMMNGRVIFGADINARTVRLRNCFVGGSVYGTDITLENCIVLGGVFGTKQTSITECVIGTFYGPNVEIAGINYMLYPSCFSIEPLSYLPGAELYNISLAHLGALYKGEPEDPNTGKIRLDLESDHQKTVLIGADDVTTIVNSYSVSGRVLAADMIDMDKLENHFLIGSGALGNQILKAYNLPKKDGSKSEPLTVENIADFFFDIMLGKIEIQTLSGEISFEEIKRNYE